MTTTPLTPIPDHADGHAFLFDSRMAPRSCAACGAPVLPGRHVFQTFGDSTHLWHAHTFHGSLSGCELAAQDAAATARRVTEVLPGAPSLDSLDEG